MAILHHKLNIDVFQAQNMDRHSQNLFDKLQMRQNRFRNENIKIIKVMCDRIEIDQKNQSYLKKFKMTKNKFVQPYLSCFCLKKTFWTFLHDVRKRWYEHAKNEKFPFLHQVQAGKFKFVHVAHYSSVAVLCSHFSE